MKPTAAVAKLAALAQPSRLAIFRLLVRRGPQGLCASDVAAELQVVPATLSFHLKALMSAGLISARQEGRFIYYTADFAAMRALLGYLTENCCRDAPCTVPAPSPALTRARARPLRRAREVKTATTLALSSPPPRSGRGAG